MNNETDINDVPPAFRERYIELIEIIDQFCDQHLDDEYKNVCRQLTFEMCQNGSPVLKAKARSWAAGIIWVIGRVNFLSDPPFEPYLTQTDFAQAIGVSKGTVGSKCGVIWNLLNLMPLDPDFTVASRIESNPLVWMVEVGGIIVDLRHVPREIQVSAYEQGLIPFIPADRPSS